MSVCLSVLIIMIILVGLKVCSVWKGYPVCVGPTFQNAKQCQSQKVDQQQHQGGRRMDRETMKNRISAYTRKKKVYMCL